MCKIAENFDQNPMKNPVEYTEQAPSVELHIRQNLQYTGNYIAKCKSVENQFFKNPVLHIFSSFLRS